MKKALVTIYCGALIITGIILFAHTKDYIISTSSSLVSLLYIVALVPMAIAMAASATRILSILAGEDMDKDLWEWLKLIFSLKTSFILTIIALTLVYGILTLNFKTWSPSKWKAISAEKMATKEQKKTEGEKAYKEACELREKVFAKAAAHDGKPGLSFEDQAELVKDLELTAEEGKPFILVEGLNSIRPFTIGLENYIREECRNSFCSNYFLPKEKWEAYLEEK